MDSTDNIVPVERNIPNKIYLLDYQSFGMSYSWYENPQNIDGIMVKPENVEYIRKDLLLEWANELTSEPYDGTTESAHKHQIANYLRDKYNSL